MDIFYFLVLDSHGVYLLQFDFKYLFIYKIIKMYIVCNIRVYLILTLIRLSFIMSYRSNHVADGLLLILTTRKSINGLCGNSIFLR